MALKSPLPVLIPNDAAFDIMGNPREQTLSLLSLRVTPDIWLFWLGRVMLQALLVMQNFWNSTGSFYILTFQPIMSFIYALLPATLNGCPMTSGLSNCGALLFMFFA
jgi:hypothetical protein